MRYHVIDVCRHIINYSNEKEYGVSNLKLQKLLYFVQAYFMLTKHEACFREKIEAWDFGPVIPVAYREYVKHGGCDIPTITHIIKNDSGNVWDYRRLPYRDVVITPDDKKLIDAVVDRFSEYSSTDLVRLTQQQRPWIDAYVHNKANEITLNSIKEYFL